MKKKKKGEENLRNGADETVENTEKVENTETNANARENDVDSGKGVFGKHKNKDEKCGEFFGDIGKDSGKGIKGKMKTFYFKMFLSFFLVILLSTVLMAMLVYVFRTDELWGYLDKRTIIDAQRLRDVVVWEGERYGSSVITEDYVSELAGKILTSDYKYEIYSDFDEMVSTEGLSLTNADKNSIELGKIKCSNHKTVVKLGKFYMAVQIKSSSSTDLARLWYSIIWMAACVTLILALLFNTFATSWVVKPVKKLSNAMLEVSKGNFDIKIDVDGSDEMASLQKTFNMMTEGLKKNEEASKEFVATLSHEYKTPISAISGYADLLQHPGITEEERREYLSIICEQARRLSNLSTEMLQLARLDTNVVGLDKEKFSLDEQIRTALLALEPMWTAKNTDLDIDLDEVTIFANKAMLSHVWENLISNAVKFTPENGKIAISLKRAGDKAVFVIKDSGCGISPEALPKIFDRFYKSKAPENAGGNGLGLSITKRVVDISGGNITVNSELGKGTEFTVTLPIE